MKEYTPIIIRQYRKPNFMDYFLLTVAIIKLIGLLVLSALFIKYVILVG